MTEDKKRLEYYNGVEKEIPRIYPDENIIQNNIYRLLLEKNNIYTSGVAIKLSKADGSTYKLLPNLFVVRDDTDFDENGVYNGNPLFVIEIVSKETRDTDVNIKTDIYSLCGIQAYWIVDVEKRNIIIKCNNVDGKYTSYIMYTYGDTIKWITNIIRTVDVFFGMKNGPDYIKGKKAGMDTAIELVKLHNENKSITDIAEELNLDVDEVYKFIERLKGTGIV